MFVITHGRPNVGKGTTLAEILKQFEINPIVVGDLCRREKKDQTPIWIKAHEYMTASRSTLWPTDILADLVEKELATLPRNSHVIMDGWLRRTDQVEPLSQMLNTHCINPQLVILEFHVSSDDVCIQRAKDRGREDDLEIYTRLEDHHSHAMPALYDAMRAVPVLPTQRIIYNGEGDEEYRRNFVTGFGLMYGLKAKKQELALN